MKKGSVLFFLCCIIGLSLLVVGCEGTDVPKKKPEVPDKRPEFALNDIEFYPSSGIIDKLYSSETGNITCSTTWGDKAAIYITKDGSTPTESSSTIAKGVLDFSDYGTKTVKALGVYYDNDGQQFTKTAERLWNVKRIEVTPYGNNMIAKGQGAYTSGKYSIFTGGSFAVYFTFKEAGTVTIDRRMTNLGSLSVEYKSVSIESGTKTFEVAADSHITATATSGLYYVYGGPPEDWAFAFMLE